MAHKKDRTVHLGEHVTLLFEDELTVRYQIQEMLRIERIFEEEGIRDELDAYNPLVPDGRNLKATMMVEYADAEERKRELAQLIGIEDRVWVEVEGSRARLGDRRRGPGARERGKDLVGAFPALRAHAAEMASAEERRCAAIGVDHPAYQARIQRSPGTRSRRGRPRLAAASRGRRLRRATSRASREPGPWSPVGRRRAACTLAIAASGLMRRAPCGPRHR